MDANCPRCREIAAVEEALDRRANDLTKRVNSLCADVRSRNRERWERFADLVSLPIIGDVIFGLFRAPAGLEEEPDYWNSSWYRPEGCEIEEGSKLLEIMKTYHIEHWGDELITPGLMDDPAGYYTPREKIRRADAYNSEFTRSMMDICARREGVATDRSRPIEQYFAHTPDKYDFFSMAGSGKLQEGAFVLDARSKKVVPLNRCNVSWEALRDTAKTATSKIVARFARTGCLYTLKRPA